jgi:Integrase core domain
MANHLRTELVLDALEMVTGQRRPGDVIHHSDQGSQYTSLAFGGRCREAGVRPSMGSVGDAYDNAMCESFFATLECELLERRRFASQAEAKMACFSFIEGWYNPVRLHSALGYRSPMVFEAMMEVVNKAIKHSTENGAASPKAPYLRPYLGEAEQRLVGIGAIGHVVPSSLYEITSERMASSVARPPALRITCASPSTRPAYFAGSSRASMHVRMAKCRAGGSGSLPFAPKLPA